MKVDAYEVIIYNTGVSYFPLSGKGSYGNAAPQLKKSFSIEIPIWDKLESYDCKLTRFPFGLAGSTITTIASAFAISKERSNLQWNCPMTSQCIVIQLILSSKGSFWFTKGILYSNETLETQERVAKGFCVMRDGPKIWPISKSIWHASCLLLVSAMSRLHGVRTKFIWLQAAQVHVSRKSKRFNHEIVTRCVTRC